MRDCELCCLVGVMFSCWDCELCYLVGLICLCWDHVPLIGEELCTDLWGLNADNLA